MNFLQTNDPEKLNEDKQLSIQQKKNSTNSNEKTHENGKVRYDFDRTQLRRQSTMDVSGPVLSNYPLKQANIATNSKTHGTKHRENS